MELSDDALEGWAGSAVSLFGVPVTGNIASAAVLDATPGPHVVLASDAGDLRRIAGHLGIRLEIVAL